MKRVTEIILEDAKQTDAADLAILDNVASHGLSLWFWQEAVKRGEAEDALALGRNRFIDPEAVFGWRNAIVAREAGQIVGSVTAYAMPEASEAEIEEAKNAGPFVPVFELFELAAEDWFIDSLAVYENARGRGVGARLLDEALQRGHRAGHPVASLVVEDGNPHALALYQSRNFETVASRPFVRTELPANSTQWLLMKTQLPAGNYNV